VRCTPDGRCGPYGGHSLTKPQARVRASLFPTLQVLVFERGPLLFVFNWSPHQSYEVTGVPRTRPTRSTRHAYRQGLYVRKH
jgi:hypothetical protein